MKRLTILDRPFWLVACTAVIVVLGGCDYNDRSGQIPVSTVASVNFLQEGGVVVLDGDGNQIPPSEQVEGKLVNEGTFSLTTINSCQVSICYLNMCKYYTVEDNCPADASHVVK